MPKVEIPYYVHYVPPAKPDPNFPSQYKFTLIDTMDKLDEYLSRNTKYMAFDLETTGLNPETSSIVGVALCQDPKEGVYVPINHYSGGLGREALDKIYETLVSKECVFVFNLRYDFRMMEYVDFQKYGYLNLTRSKTVGYDMSKVKYLDVSIPCFLADTNIGSYAMKEVHFKKWYQESNKQLKPLSLKHYSLHFLGWEQQKFSEVLGSNENFYYVDPVEATFYASTDALATYHLAIKTMPFLKEAGFSGKINNQFLYPLMRCEQNTVLLDKDYLLSLEREIEPKIQKAIERMKRVVAQISPYYVIPSKSELGFDVNFNMNSPKQIEKLFKEMGVDTGVYTKTGQMKVGKDEMQKIVETYDPSHLAYQFAEAYLEYKKLEKMLGTYIKPFHREVDMHDGRTRFSYRVDRVPTTRLAGGKDSVKKGEPYFALMNIQSIVKPKSVFWYTRRARKDSKGLVLLGWEFSPTPFPDEEEQYMIEGFSPELNLRKVLKADEGYLWVSCDFQAQELRIPTSLSKEPVWIKAFLSGDDVHKATAIQIWGEENYNKDLRKKAKAGAFGLIYGGNEYTMQKNLGLSPEEAKDFVQRFRNALPTLFRYFDNVIREARQKHVVKTFFGAPRRLKFFYKSNDYKLKAFADRTAQNSPIQGTGADILKISLIRLWEHLYNHPDWKDDCNFICTVHDEINSQVKVERVEEFMKIKHDLMALKIPGWQVPMEVGVSVGYSWGELFDFRWDEENQGWVPKHEGVPYKGEEKGVEEEIELEDEEEVEENIY